MKKFNHFLHVIVALLITTVAMSQSTVTGKIIDSDSDSPLPGANIIEEGTTNGTTSDIDGNFTITTQSTEGRILVTYVGYANKILSFSANKNFGSIYLSNDNTLEEVIITGSGVIDLAEGRETPVAVSTIRGKDIQLKVSGNAEFGEALKNTPSIYVSNQAGGFGDSQIFLRGFDQINTAYLLNGQPINGMEDGRMYWSNWSGMSDVANGVQIQRGLGSSKLAISSVGGTVNIVSKSTDQKEGGFARVLGGNDSYFKTTAAYNTGLSENGWAFSFLIDHWQAHRKFSEGTEGRGQNYLLSFGYKPNEKNSFNFLITGAPQYHDQNFSKDLEDYEQYGEKYNGNSGFLDGERFTERRNYYHKPVANLNWDFNIDEGLDLATVLYASWGRGGGTGGLGRGRVRNDDTGLIDFDQIESNNIESAAGSGIGNFGDSYLRRSSVNNHNWYGLISNLTIEKSENWSYNVGLDARTYKGDHFRQINDFLGLDGYNDNFRTDRPDDYIITESFEADPWKALSNFADEGQRYDRDYSERIRYVGGFGQVEFANDNFSTFLQAALSTQSYEREGRLSGVGDGLGKSDKISKGGYNLKGGAAYKINEMHSIFANAGFYSRQPFLDNVFANIRYSNELVSPDVDNEEITGFEAGYRFKNNTFRLNFDLYRSEWGNRFLSINGPELENEETSTYRLTDVTQVHTGAEFDFEYRPTNASWSLRGYGSVGNWEYDGSTPFTLQNNETGEFVTTDGNVDLSGVKVGNAPQTSFGAGFRFDITEKLSVDGDYNFYANLYEFVDPADVAEDALGGGQYESIELDSYGLADAGLTYRFSIGEDRLTIRANVYNLFNNSYINQRDAFGYYLGIGRTFNTSIRYNF